MFSSSVPTLLMAGRLALRSAEAPAFCVFLRSTTTSLDLKRKAGGNTTASAPPGSIRTEADLPEVSLPTVLYRLIIQGYYNNMHELQLMEKQRYGPIYKVRGGDKHTIVLNSVALLEELMRKDDKFPTRGDMALWTEYRDMHDLGYGPVTEEGEKWYKLRSVLNKRMLHPKDSVKYENVVNDVVTDFIKRICHLRKMSSTGDLVPNMSNELYRFSLEGISRILFETRIGCLENEIPPETQNFINSIAQMFTYTMALSVLPKWTRNYLPFWRRYTSGWDGIFRFAGKLIDRKLVDIQKRLDEDQEVAGEYLSYLLSNTNMREKDVYGSITELLLAGVDTTSNTMMWALYLLSQDPKAQDTLYQEVNSVINGDKIPTAEDINRMPYLKAVIKETLRMYPVVPMNARLLSEKDVIIGGHFFPKKTTFIMHHYAIGHDETIFPEPKIFKPERWLRDRSERPSPFGSIPFGFGVRGCVGKRIAELEMHLALARIIKLFEVKLDPKVGEVKALSRIVLVADKTVNFHFLERKQVTNPLMAGRLALCRTETKAIHVFLRPITASLGIQRSAGGNSVASVPSGSIRTKADLPEVSLPTVLYRLVIQGYYNRMHELQLYEKQLYGPMFKVRDGKKHKIVLNSVELLEELMRKDDKFPNRGDKLWNEYRDMNGLGYGPATEEGEKWYKLRSVLNKRMLHPKDSVKYENVVNEVVTDFIKRICHLRKMSSTGDLVPNMSNELYLFSLEGISRILFETRIGCLENEIPPETQNFINSIAQMFTYTMAVIVLPKWTRNYLPFWRRYTSGWDGIFKFAGKLIDRKLVDIQKRLDEGQEVAGEYLSYLLSNTNMSKKDVYGSITELLLGGVDTTSNTMMWALYLLSQDPKAQDTLYQEVNSVINGDKIPTAEDINRMPYLKAVIKETLRMYPVVPVNVRLLSETDVIIGGHFFPKETLFLMHHYAIGHDQTTFPEPNVFKPERWLRDGRERPSPFGSIPFGFGVRGCVGKRIAELEMHLALARIIKLFEVKLDPKVGEVKALSRIVLVADKTVNFHFLERKKVTN
ncbi:hypothetical protein QTP86_021576 [Hemibagrus guttatus]|nr:hypothetical protein QTP86_021576 [Hemibagrus guttatus]